MIKNYASDLGYAYIQAKNADKEVKFDSYIKRIKESDAIEIRNNIEKFDSNHILVKFNKSYYVLGKLAIENYPSLTKRLVITRLDDLAVIQYLTSISLLTEDVEINCNLAIGLPNRSRAEKDKSENFFQDLYIISFLTKTEEVSKIIRFNEIQSIPQSVSVAFAIEEEYRHNRILVVDIGYGTSDCALLDNMQLSKDAGNRYFNRGVELIFKTVEDAIYNSDFIKKYKIPKLSEQTIQTIIETGVWKINGQNQPEIKNLIDDCFKEFIDELYNNIVGNISSLADCDLLLGSGGIFTNKEFLLYFSNKFKEYGFTFATDKDPAWAVCHGLYNFAELCFDIENEVEDTKVEVVQPVHQNKQKKGHE